MDRPSKDPAPLRPTRRLVVGPVSDLIRNLPRGVACGPPTSGVIASSPRPRDRPGPPPEGPLQAA